MKNLIQAVVVTLFAVSTAQAQQAVQWKVSVGGNGHWYVRVPQGQSWANARAAAEAAGGHLATTADAAENAFIATLVTSSDAWIGGFQEPNTCEPGCDWRWVTGEAWEFSGWGPGEPNDWGSGEDGVMLLPSGQWNDGMMWVQAASIIEWSADCNGDGIVDYGQCRDGSLPDYNRNNVPDCCESQLPCVVGNYPVQWRVEEGGNGHWYQTRSCVGCCFASAVQSAQYVGGHLATLSTAGEQDRLIPVVPLGQAAKLGGFRSPNSDLVSGWRWITGEAFNSSLVSWAEGNPGCCGPNQYWLYLQNTPGPGTGLHDGFDCSPVGADVLLLEWSDDCNNDGIVDKGQILLGHLSDSDNDGIPDACECPCDVVRDLSVNGIDLAVVLGQWGPANQFTVTDFNRDGSVDGDDLGILLGAWGPCTN